MFILFPVVYLFEKNIRIFTGKSRPEVVSGKEIEAFIDM
jgi:hypothetical protein